ncbi:unnamed protein product [Amoebophrya sp. A120]|nr:unnamed protein product [Amoebophrya sp. A120]|eukprot:GSA120T00017636001.1
MRKAALLSSLTGAVALESGASSGIMKVVKLLQDTKADLIKERKTQEQEYMKLDCVVKKTKEENAKLREENSGKIADIDSELALLEGGKTLTDEAQVFAAKIDEKNKEIEKAEADLDAEKEKYDTYMADLKAGIAALADAEKKIQGQTLLVQQKTLKSLLAKAKLLPAQQIAMLKFEKQAPEAYSSQVGSIVELIQTLKNEYKKEEIDTTTQHEKDVAAQEALIKELKEALSGLQEQQQAGEGEAAAKARRTQELTDLKTTLEGEIADADAEDKVMDENKTKQDTEYETFSADSMAQEDAIDKAVEILHSDDNRDLFQKNEDDKEYEAAFFLQKASITTEKVRSMKELQLARERETAIQVLMAAISDQVSELKDEKKSIETSVEHCRVDSKKLIEDAKTAAEQMDGQDAQIRASTEIIEMENEKQKKLTEEIADKMEEKRKKTEIFEESKKDLEAIKDDLTTALGEVRKAILELRKYKPEKTSRFNEGSKGDLTKKTSNPLAPVITMLDGIVSQMDNEKTDRTTQITDLQAEQDEMVKTIGNASPMEESMMVTTIETPESIIGGKEKERNDSVTKEAEEEAKKTSAETDYASEREKLYGTDGTTGLLASFNKLQPGCDYWMLGSQARFAAIAEEISTLDEVKHVLSNQDLVFDGKDTMEMEAREKGADAKDHQYEDVTSRVTGSAP